MSDMSIYGGATVVSSWVRAIDLIKIANQLFEDKMQYAQISVKFCENENFDGDVRICAISSPTSEDIKVYPVLKQNSLIDVDTDIFEDEF